MKSLVRLERGAIPGSPALGNWQEWNVAGWRDWTPCCGRSLLPWQPLPASRWKRNEACCHHNVCWPADGRGMKLVAITMSASQQMEEEWSLLPSQCLPASRWKRGEWLWRGFSHSGFVPASPQLSPHQASLTYTLADVESLISDVENLISDVESLISNVENPIHFELMLKVSYTLSWCWKSHTLWADVESLISDFESLIHFEQMLKVLYLMLKVSYLLQLALLSYGSFFFYFHHLFHLLLHFPASSLGSLFVSFEIFVYFIFYYFVFWWFFFFLLSDFCVCNYSLSCLRGSCIPSSGVVLVGCVAMPVIYPSKTSSSFAAGLEDLGSHIVEVFAYVII